MANAEWGSRRKREKLKSLCQQLGLSESVIDESQSYFQNYLSIMNRAAERLFNLIREERRLEAMFPQLLGVYIIPEEIPSIMDRLKRVTEILKNKHDQISSEIMRIKQECGEIEKISDPTAILERINALRYKFEVLDVQFEFFDHLSDESKWLQTLLEKYFARLKSR